MPSGIDGALKQMKLTSEIPVKVKLDGWAGQNLEPKKTFITEATIDPAAEGVEKCRKRMAEAERKIKSIKDKMDALPPTKKNKPEIAAFKEKVLMLQGDGDYRAALAYVRKLDDDEREKRREEKEAAEEAAGGLQRRPGQAAASSSSDPKAKVGESKIREAQDSGEFEADTEVVAVVTSAVDGSAQAQGQLQAGPGTIVYKSQIRHEVASMAYGAKDLLSAKMKRAATQKTCMAAIRSLLWNPPAVLPALPAVLMLLDEAKIKKEAESLLRELVTCGPAGKAVPDLVLPVLLAHLGAAAGGKWQVKVGTMQLLKTVLQRMGQECPKQLGWSMPKVMAAFRDAASDARKDVRKEAEGFLRYMGEEMVKTPEICAKVDDIVGSLTDSANMDKAAATLQALANTTFLNAMDACSFSLLFPIVSRAMRERTHEAKTMGCKIMGASVDLIEDPDFLHPYVSELMPLLKECLMHPTASVQREAAKSFGSLSAGLPALCEEDIYPFLLEKLECSTGNEDVSEVDRRGAAHGLAELVLKRSDLMAGCLQNVVLPRISGGKKKETKAGGLAVFVFLPHLGPQAFLPHLVKCLPVILKSLMEAEEAITKQTMECMRVIIHEYGATYPAVLMPWLQWALMFEGEEARDLAAELFSDFCGKVADTMNFGQDFLSMEVISQVERHSLLSSIFIACRDESSNVRRLASLLWKEKLQSGQKAKGELLKEGLLLKALRALELSAQPFRKAVAASCLKELIASGDVGADEAKGTEPLSSGPFAGDGGVPVAESGAEAAEDPAPPPPPRGQLLLRRATAELAKVDLPGPLRNYLETAVVSCCVEAPSLAAARASAEAEVAPIVDPKESAAAGSALAALGIAPALDVVFDGVADEVAKAGAASMGKSEDSLVRVDNLMMMYGGGNILLKNSTLDLRRGHRYGVVGRNGAGKTTLMSMIANGGVTQIPPSIKTLHVRPEVLVEASDLTATQFCAKDSPESSEEELEAALQKVGFPKDMQAKSVNELSGGWRMKLLLASAMMRQCDILLLDEPTNHLDKESVVWLSKYLVSLTKSTLMVISHDPYFLNEVCTDIIQYSGQRTLEYYPGNFADFREAKKLSDQDSEALLLGNECDLGENPDIPAEEVDSGLALTAGALDKQAKITFPLPGKLAGHSTAKPVVEMKDVNFAYNEEEGPLILSSVTCKVTLSSRIGIVGANGAGKSTLLNLICGELTPSPSGGFPPPEGAQRGEVTRHRNLRLAYIAQQHMYHLSEFMNSCPYIYIQRRFKEGFDEALQRRLIDPANEEEAKLRTELAKRWGKYGNEVRTVIGRVVKGNEVFYEVQWMGLDDPKQNTWETIGKLKNLGVVSIARAYDERQAATAAGNDQRPLSQKEILKHLESFGLNEDQVLNQHIGSFSAGQKSKLTLGAAFWTKPHVVALDEPTNYIDMETLDALAKALQRFKGGMVVISHSSDFVERVCTEQWLVEGNTISKVTKCEVAAKK